MLAAICGSEARVRLIRSLFERPIEYQSLSSVAKSAKTDPANALRTLRKLVNAKLIEVTDTTSGPRYRPRRDTPVFNHFHALFSPEDFADSNASSHVKLDEHKRRIGELLVERHSLDEIRAKSIENLKRWRANGVWSAVYDEWMGILEHGSNVHLVSVMTSRDDDSNRLRQSMPCVGLLRLGPSDNCLRRVGFSCSQFREDVGIQI